MKELFKKLLFSDNYEDVQIAISIWPEDFLPKYEEIKQIFRDNGKDYIFTSVLNKVITSGVDGRYLQKFTDGPMSYISIKNY